MSLNFLNIEMAKLEEHSCIFTMESPKRYKQLAMDHDSLEVLSFINPNSLDFTWIQTSSTYNICNSLK